MKLLPLVDVVRSHGILIVHAPHGRKIYEAITPLPGEIVIEGPNEQAELLKILKQRNIKWLFYAGYASNMCILNRAVGIIEMARKDYRTILVRDASLAVETPGSLNKKWTHKVAIDMVELNWGATTTGDIIDALEKTCAAGIP